jgi:uncharacterized protein (DUF58 family)
MITPELRAQIRHIEIHTRRLLSGLQIGDYSTALKGSGLEFDQLRDYQEGDDVRFIDWNSSVRMNKILVKQYLEERNRTIILIVDTSASVNCGSSIAKIEVITQIACMLALAAEYGKDCVGLILFSGTVDLYIPPKRGRAHSYELMQALLTYQKKSPSTGSTSLRDALEYMIQRKQRDALAFIISDFIDHTFENVMGVASRLYEIVAVRCLDPLERALPAHGIIMSHDAETKESFQLPVEHYAQVTVNALLSQRLMQQDVLLKKYKVDLLDINTAGSFSGELIRFFRKRMMY